MPTFILKKYAEPKETPKETQENTEQPGVQKTELKKELTVEVTGSISEIVANALNKVLVNKDVKIEETEAEPGTVQAISTEDINASPVETLRKVKGANVLLITGSGFSTAQEEWFLSNVENNVGKIFYSVNAFISHIESEFSDDR